MEYYLGVFKKYADFTGRARRKEYWMFILFNLIANIILSVLSLVPFLAILSLIYSLGVFIPSIAVTARRLHDTGRSGWWQVAPMGVAIFVGIGAAMGHKGMIIGTVILLLLVSIALLVFMCQDSEGGDNQYGENPKGVDELPEIA